MEMQAWFYVKLSIGVLIVVVGLVGFCVLTFRGRLKAGSAFVTLVLIGSWMLTGGKIKAGSYEAQAEDFSKVAQAISLSNSKSTDIERLVELNERGVATWWKLLQYRIEIRSLLHKICKDVRCQIKGTDVGFEKLLGVLADRGLISQQLISDLDRIRVSTYYAEWRDGDAPNEDAVTFVLKTAPGAIRQLQAISGVPSGSPK